MKLLLHSILFLTALSTSLIGAEETMAPERYSGGVLEISFSATVEEAPGGAHGGWDFFDGSKKQLWVGSGWLVGDQNKWGLWSPKGKAGDFSRAVKSGEKVNLSCRIDFENQSVVLLESGKEISRLDGVRLSGIDRAAPFVRQGGRYELTTPKFSHSGTGVGARELFTEKILPIFAEKCAGCHGDTAKKIKGEFDMRSLAGLLKGGESGEPSLVPGNPDESPLFLSVTWKDPDFEMPPKENDRLTPSQIADLRAWIEGGAPWVKNAPEKEITGSLGTWLDPDEEGNVKVVTSGGTSDIWTQRRYDPKTLWAYQPRKKVTPPSPGHPVDAFIDAGLASAGIKPAPRADETTLARRIAYSLTGLPPSSVAMSYEKRIDALLESPHYGERMAQQWLDVTRYADSNGFSRDDERPQAHIYRSYVIESFNADKPFNRFAKEQIAGDELGIAGQDALAFLWMGPWEMTAMTAAAVARQMWLDDVVNTVGVTFLGQELRCAKCHDHKFDPIPTRDFYALHAIFAGTKHHVKNGDFQIQPQSPEKISILKGGSLETPTESVSPGLMSAMSFTEKFKVPESAEGRRATLANWIAADENPMTARVIVNRVWQWHFGRGLVATPNGFGVVGTKPSHPELLDWLANWFVDNDWSLKKLNRLILTSAAYQRSTKHPDRERLGNLDPNGELLASFRPRRLTAEEIRDSMLAVSGELNRKIGGPGFRAEINWEVAFQPRLAMGKIVAPWEPEPKRADRNRRSVYALRIRNLGHPLMEVLNRPLSDLSCEKRDETTVVTQAFSLFHGEFTNDRALAVADRAKSIDQVFALILNRPPTEAESTRVRSHVEKMIEHHKNNPPVKTTLPTEVTLSNVIEKTGQPAYTTFPLKRLQNYERDLQPWEVSPETRALAELALVLLNSSEFLHVY